MTCFIAIPSFAGVKNVEVLNALEATVLLLEGCGVKTALSILQGNCYLQDARNKLVKMFLDSGADKMLFLDDDVVWNPGDAKRLVLSEDDICAGIYPLKKSIEDYPVVLNCHEDGTPKVRDDGALLCVAAPTGFICISRAAILKLIENNQDKKFTDNDKVYYDLFPQGVSNGRWVGEDFAFCALWVKLGGKIWVYPDMTLEHHDRFKGKVYVGNYHQCLMKLPKPEEV